MDSDNRKRVKQRMDVVNLELSPIRPFVVGEKLHNPKTRKQVKISRWKNRA